MYFHFTNENEFAQTSDQTSFFTDDLKMITIKGLSVMGEAIRRQTLKNMCHSFFNTGYRLVAWEPDMLHDTLFFKELSPLRELLEKESPDVIAWRPVGNRVTWIFDKVDLGITTLTIHPPTLKEKTVVNTLNQFDEHDPLMNHVHQSPPIMPDPANLNHSEFETVNQFLGIPNVPLLQNPDTCCEIDDGIRNLDYPDHDYTAGDRLERLTNWINK